VEVIYLKYIHGIRYSIIKEGENVIMSDSKIIPFNSTKKVKTTESISYSNNKNNAIKYNIADKIDEEITIFFFDAIHKNHLLSKKK